MPILLTPREVAHLYKFPAVSAAGLTIGILEFEGGYLESDVQTYFNDIGVPIPNIINVFVDGASAGGFMRRVADSDHMPTWPGIGTDGPAANYGVAIIPRPRLGRCSCAVR
jgi:hypothetical protein